MRSAVLSIHPPGRPQGETTELWPPRPSRRRRLLLRLRRRSLRRPTL